MYCKPGIWWTYLCESQDNLCQSFWFVCHKNEAEKYIIYISMCRGTTYKHSCKENRSTSDWDPTLLVAIQWQIASSHSFYHELKKVWSTWKGKDSVVNVSFTINYHGNKALFKNWRNWFCSKNNRLVYIETRLFKIGLKKM